MTNKEHEAYDKFKDFIDYCEQNNVMPQYIMMMFGSETFWGTFKYMMNYNWHNENPETD